jgi:hypothetical protein
VGHVEQLGEMRSQYTISDEISDHIGDLDVFYLLMYFYRCKYFRLHIVEWHCSLINKDYVRTHKEAAVVYLVLSRYLS